MKQIRPLVPVLVILAACGGGDAGRVSLQVEHDTVGDTVVVRTVAGQAWDADASLVPEMRIGAFEGEDVYMLGDVNGLAVAPDGSVYIYDRQVPALRKYDRDGEYVATFGREGEGPGEYKQSDGGLAVLPDGRVLLRDPGNGRINVYSPTGESLDHWDLRGGYFTSRPLFVDTAGAVYTQIWGTGEDGERYGGLARYSSDGEPLDSILAPEWDYEPAQVTFQGERMRMSNNVPFSPRSMWAFSPHGYYVGGVSSRYGVELFRPDASVLRIERAVDPVPVQRDEAANARERTEANFRQAAPDWRWNGPDVPDTKPPFSSIQVGVDGRVWVQVAQAGVRRADSDDGSGAGGVAAGESGRGGRSGDTPPDRWAEPVVYDVFEPDGTYLGQVRGPDDFQRYPTPVFGRDHVWAVVTDELGVEYLTRFRIDAGGPDDAAG
jgi:hypothetical protein